MEEIRDRELGIVGERYRSFLEFYRVNDARPLNALYADTGDGAADGIFEVADGVMFAPEDTREALLYGTDMYHERFEQARIGAQRVLRDKYEWLSEERFESDTHGQNVIVERHVLGHPKSFSRRRPNMTKRRSVRVLYDAMCPASTPLQERIEAGCSVLAAMGALESIGYEVALSFVLAKYSGSNAKGDATLVLDIPLKDFGERALPAKTEFPLASKSMLFHVGCWWAHRFARTPVNYGEGEGYPVSYDKGRIAAMRAYAEKHHGVYVSEDIVEVQLGTDPVQVLEHVVAGMGEERELLARLRGESRLDAGIQPEQGKMFMKPTNGDGGDWPKSTNRDGGGWSKPTNGDSLSRPESDGPGGESQEDAAGSDSADNSTSGDASSGSHDAAQGGESVSGNASNATNGDGGGWSKPTNGDSPSWSESGESGDESQGEAEPGGGGVSPDADEQSTRKPHDERAEDGLPGDTKAKQETGAGSMGDADGEDDEDGIESESEGAAMASETQENGIDFTQITKALEDDMLDADPAMPQSAEEFVVMLRRRYMMFEQGDYLNMMIGEKMARRKAAKAERESGAPLVPPPSVDAPTLDNVQFGTPRNTPFSMTSIPHKKK